MFRLVTIASLMLVLLVSVAQAQRDQRGVSAPRDGSDFRSQRGFGGSQRSGVGRDNEDFRGQRGGLGRDDGDGRGGFGRGGTGRGGFAGFGGTGRNLVYLGERLVNLVGDRDVIRVDQPEAWFDRRAFDALVFYVSDNDIELGSVTIRHINGYVSSTRNINTVVRQGRSFNLPLDNPVSYIRDIELTYVANPAGGRQARVTIYGETTRVRPAGREEWIRFDCEPVSIFEGSLHEFEIGRREGRFMSIRVYALVDSIEIWDIKVQYANGSTEDLPVWNRFLSPGSSTEELDLRGSQRSLDRILLRTRSAILPVDIVLGVKVRRPHVCVEGLQYVPRDLRSGPGGGAPPAAAPVPPRTN